MKTDIKREKERKKGKYNEEKQTNRQSNKQRYLRESEWESLMNADTEKHRNRLIEMHYLKT